MGYIYWRNDNENSVFMPSNYAFPATFLDGPMESANIGDNKNVDCYCTWKEKLLKIAHHCLHLREK
jgi:hypothetical protein